MMLVCVSRGTLGGGVAVAEKLASKLGCPCVSREELADAATQSGIRVGKLEMAVAKRLRLTEALAAERDRFGAFVVESLAQRLQEGSVVYHGRTGQVLLPGLGHIFRVRVITDEADRIERAMARLRVSRDKARRYIEEVDDDRRRWVHALYGVDWTDPHGYDAVMNLSRMSVDNAATALLAMVQLPEFQPTPAARKVLEDLWLTARCRLAIGHDRSTRHCSVTIRADRGQVAVTYLPRDRDAAQHIPEILEKVDGVSVVRCTMATTTLLWVQERFSPSEATLAHLADIAGRWGAAIELARFVAAPAAGEGGAAEAEQADARQGLNGGGAAHARAERDGKARTEPKELGGIIDDTAEEDGAAEPTDDGGLEPMVDQLVQLGYAGGAWQLSGDAQDLVDRIGHTTPYALAVVGDVYLDKGQAVRKRMTRELAAQLGDSLHVPVVQADELAKELLFGPKQWMRFLAAAAITAAALWVVLTHQHDVLTFLTRDGVANRILAASALALFVPIFAFVYGIFAQSLLRLFKFD